MVGFSGMVSSNFIGSRVRPTLNDYEKTTYFDGTRKTDEFNHLSRFSIPTK